MKLIEHRIHRIPSISSLCNWWKSRRFKYEVHANLSDHPVAKEWRGKSSKESEHNSGGSACDLNPPLGPLLNDNNMSEMSELILGSSDSISLNESIDSLDSAVDPQYIRIQENTSASFDNFLMAHLKFLSLSTQPQEVELVYQMH